MTISDLDRVIEALHASLSTMADMHGGDDCVFADSPGDGCLACVAQRQTGEALTLLRQMREGAVEGHVDGLKEWDFDTQAERLDFDGVLRMWAKPYRKHDVPALLILTPEDS